ncbi:MAG: shikimate dehydrogenase [Thermovenabulum sp.]|uniref:shikimate dehydrogenase n=1 Tax=Thermovenabulum sp. TaxID=3100335 RepID=UPI003C7ED4C9
MVKLELNEMPELAVIGWPLHKTFSPIMQNAALKSAGLSWRYEAIPIPKEHLSDFFFHASQKMRGFNVTMPYKSDVYKLCSEVDDFAQKCGAVNTVVFHREGTESKPYGYNTDGPGLLKALSEKVGNEIKISSSIILGAGGAAAGCAAALASFGVKTISIINRTMYKAEELAKTMGQNFKNVKWNVLNLEEGDKLQKAFEDAELIVNCIPEEGALLFEPIIEKCDAKDKMFCDLSYSEKPGKLYLKAQKMGYIVVSGIDVLLWQGVYAFEIFTGKPAPVKTMKDALTEKIGSWWLGC